MQVSAGMVASGKVLRRRGRRSGCRDILWGGFRGRLSLARAPELGNMRVCAKENLLLIS